MESTAVQWAPFVLAENVQKQEETGEDYKE